MKKHVLLFALVLILSTLNIPRVEAATFNDLDTVPWAADEIEFLSDRGIINGYNANTFGPKDSVTRGQATKMLVDALYPNVVQPNVIPFSDVEQGKYYTDAVIIAAEKGVVNGWPDGTFRPTDSITREATAKIIDNAYEIERGDQPVNFSDVGGWSEESIVDLASQGLINGYSDGTFRPRNAITRAEFAVILAAIIDSKIVEEPSKSSIHAFEREVVELTNDERVTRGLKPLEIDGDLSKVARLKSQDMSSKGYFSHQSPTYGSPFEMMDEFDITYRMAAENIAAGQSTPEKVVQGWMNSDGHRANILTEGLTHIGVGFVEGGSYRTYWTQMFISK